MADIENKVIVTWMVTELSKCDETHSAFHRNQRKYIYEYYSKYWAHPASYPMGTGGPLTGGKAAGAWADHSPPTSAEVKNTWTYTFIPHTSSWRSA
jgi:hypothetical protein